MSYYPHAATGTTYPYSAYHPASSTAYPTPHVQTPGAYPTAAYQTPYPHTGYGATWPYPYSYFPPQAPTQTQPAPRPSVSTTAVTTTPAVTASVAPPPPPHRTSSITATPSTYTYTPSHARETVAAAATGGAGTRSYRKQASYKGLFTKELRNLMYGFGDDRNPSSDTVNVLEEILVEYIVDVCQTALAPGKKARLSIEDLRRALSRPADAKKLARMEELLFMQEDIKRARAQFEESDMNQAGSYQA